MFVKKGFLATIIKVQVHLIFLSKRVMALMVNTFNA